MEQATGIARATLRIWERRYGFPQPGRDLRGERSYPDEQVRKLRLIADLMARGHRPGRLVELSATQLASLAGPSGSGRRRPRAAPRPRPIRCWPCFATMTFRVSSGSSRNRYAAKGWPDSSPGGCRR
ncbi:MerR family transcriptional regulator [Ramlibacter montanisoli]|uniref:MerR family transcriptional regulator n=1 Tax=Ramlibacter montanisoli TaxID=2732512 RepID=A0A849K1U5_9BURK|nr:MerR family transcriptional regulator [Ramlibacter montanisoli]NNU42468.1 MerR family transcriptional regulator [Ramlibacter montanisoli]